LLINQGLSHLPAGRKGIWNVTKRVITVRHLEVVMAALHSDRLGWTRLAVVAAAVLFVIAVSWLLRTTKAPS
jgi:hypothetical protein